MRIHEYQAKALLARYDIDSPPGDVCASLKAVRRAAKILLEKYRFGIVVKAQIHAGKRGHGTFKNGFNGGIRFCNTVDEAAEYASMMLGEVLVTPDTGPGGLLVDKILVEGRVNKEREYYFSIIIDSAQAAPVILASAFGGEGIERPERIAAGGLHSIVVDPETGVLPRQAQYLAAGLGLQHTHLWEVERFIMRAYEAWCGNDALFLEINPFTLIEDHNRPVCMVIDAKFCFDENALFRHPHIRLLSDPTQEHPLEAAAHRLGLRLVKLDGDIACVGNGAGLLMSTIDLITRGGGRPSCFLDLGGGVDADRTREAIKLVLSDPDTAVVFVNVFAGLTTCREVAKGIVNAVRQTPSLPALVIRMAGNDSSVGTDMITSFLPDAVLAHSFDDGIAKAIKAAVLNKTTRLENAHTRQ
ncbi:MAG: succinate--CoA ligase subunit beta [Verrucomicrobia bacterium]|nr:succinate--CoA ligase subunit beta [Verrucomicrobiota bacterium]